MKSDWDLEVVCKIFAKALFLGLGKQHGMIIQISESKKCLVYEKEGQIKIKIVPDDCEFDDGQIVEMTLTAEDLYFKSAESGSKFYIEERDLFYGEVGNG